MKTQRELSEQAQVAKLCRQYCKSIGVKCSATSSSFAGGDSVDVDLENQPPEIMEQIKTELKQYQYGHFDGMNDIYEYSNSNKDIPQTKYMSISNRFTDDIKVAAWEMLRKNHNDDEGQPLPESYKDAGHTRLWNDWADSTLWQMLNGSRFSELSTEFWDSQKVKAPVIQINKADAPTEGMTIREGTKAGYSEILFSDKPDETTRDTMKAAGFRWSRYNGCWWGKTENLPFSDKDQPTPPSGGNPTPKKQNGDKFRAMADKLEPQIADKLAPRQENTAKRQAQAAHARLEGEKLKRTQAALYAMADFQDDTGELPHVLAGINSKKAVYDLMGEKLSPVSNGYHGYHVGSGEMHDTHKENPQAVALWSLLKPKSHHEKQADYLAQKVRELQGCKIPGYFPTQKPVIKMALDYACIQDYHAVLEPEAGSGAFCDAIAEILSDQGRLDCFEINHTLNEILTAKGYDVKGGDFMTTNIYSLFDRVVMNPPFENLQDIDHVLHAFKFLKSGGRLVAIMSPSFEHNSNKKAEAFRLWLDNLTHEVVDIPAGAFKEAGTMISSKLVVIDKD